MSLRKSSKENYQRKRGQKERKKERNKERKGQTRQRRNKP